MTAPDGVEVVEPTAVAAPTATEGLLRTSLFERHQALGARLVPFSGWEMPVQYRGILDEHRAVRTRAGLFDLSHMGEIWLSGAGAGAALAHALVSDPPRLAIGRAQYSMICAPDGGILDDLIVYRVAEERFLVVPNASNAPRVAEELRARSSGFDAAIDDASLRTALVAIQGPRAAEILAPLSDVDLEALRYYAIAEGQAAGVPAWVARTGYTGEDGFELFVAWQDAGTVWDRLLEAGDSHELSPVGLGARDTLRLEAGMPLYGNELGPETNPFEAGLDRVVKLDKPGDFVGREILEKISAAAAEPRKILAGLAVRGRGIARQGHPIYLPGVTDFVGVVTSGTASPTLGHPIAMAYLPPDASRPGTMVEVGIRASRVPAEVVPLPFYQRRRAG
ncbi:MAG: glycine cleavage system aminomethyltransferase GcvT [Chloroflexi bacterium]|nr:glycine cleavage system aminomethyltransferase GcvT [Chloroflexota bacterium]